MKNLLILLLFPIYMYGQSVLPKEYPFPIDIQKAGSCSSPDGTSTEIASPPPDYQFLEDNGYCLYSYPTTSGFSACFTIVSPGTDIDFNAGFSHTCGNVQFNNFTLYDASCNIVGTGLSFTGLTPGATYTWCLDMRAFGGPLCNGFDNFCPYYINNSVALPITLLEFKGKCGALEWATLSEVNNDYFIIETSVTGEYWVKLDTIKGKGNSHNVTKYYYFDTPDKSKYYRLGQVDYDGRVTYFPPIAVHCEPKVKYIISITDILGRDMPIDSPGILYIKYSNGKIEQTIRK